MELNTILELVKAGFTKDEIMQMAQQTTPNPNPEPVQTPVDNNPQPTEPKPAPTQVVEPVAPAVPAPAPVPFLLVPFRMSAPPHLHPYLFQHLYLTAKLYHMKKICSAPASAPVPDCHAPVDP